MPFKKFAAISILGALASAQRLDKPALENNLDYLNQGLLDHLTPTQSTTDQWGAGWIPADCKQMAENAGLSASDIETFNVHYTDCGDAWVLCRHTSSQDPLVNMIDMFGRLPIQMRQWVRHVIALPDPNNGGHAYNSGGNIAMFNRINGDISVFIHEAGHSLDLLGAYPNNPLSSSDAWMNNYNMDPNVPDNYAKTNIVEDVAQVTVVAMFDANVPGGLGSVEPNWNNIFHQYATLQWQANLAGGLFNAGESGACTHRLTNSAPVPQSNSKRTVPSQSHMPNVTLSHNVKIIPGKKFHTGDCVHW